MSKTNCKECGKLFTIKKKSQIFCSTIHRLRFFKRRRTEKHPRFGDIGFYANSEYDTFKGSVVNANNIAKRVGAIGTLLREDIISAIKSQNYICDNPYCKKDLNEIQWHLDHKISFHNHGANTKENIHILCHRCNEHKGIQNWDAFLVHERLMSHKYHNSIV